MLASTPASDSSQPPLAISLFTFMATAAHNILLGDYLYR